MQNNIIKVAIQGDKASFHEIAAMNYYKQPMSLIYCKSFEEVFSVLINNKADKAFVAVSNSNHGEIDEVATLLRVNNVVTEGEYLLPIKQHIIGVSGADLVNVKKVISHPVALSQCSDYLGEHLKSVERESYYDTSAAVAYVKKLEDPTVVAIGSDRAAQLHGLVILRYAIQNDKNNATRFKSLSKA